MLSGKANAMARWVILSSSLYFIPIADGITECISRHPVARNGRLTGFFNSRLKELSQLKVSAVLFDLFETLVTEFSDGKRISNRFYNYLELLGIPNSEFKQEWGNRISERMTGAFADYPSVVRDILSKRGLNINEESIEYLYQQRLREKEIPFRQIRPEIIDLLSFLKSKKIKLGLVSNCSEEEVRQWSASGISTYFDDTIFSYEIGYAKPDVMIYKLACERLNIEPSEIIFVGDGGSDELMGAYRAGITPFHAVWFNTHVESNFAKLASPMMLKEMINDNFLIP